MSEEAKRIEYCKTHNIHHLFELLATKVLVDRPENPFEYLRDLLVSVEASEKKTTKYDPTEIKFAADEPPSSAPKTSGLSSTEEGGVSGATTVGEGAGDHAVAQKKKVPKKITLATLGLNNAGKTTIISALGGEIVSNTTPTVGFTPVHFHTEDYDICLFDLGGAANFRSVWVHYFPDCHGLIYVVDSASDDSTLEESLKVLQDTLSNPYMKDKPVLILANKKDLETSRLADILPEGFLENILPDSTPFRVTATCGLEEDDERDEHVEWLLDCISQQYDVLGARVQRDIAQVKEEKKRAREARLAAMREEGN